MRNLNILRLLFLLVLLPVGSLFLPRTAHAGVTCSATGSTVAFGAFDPQTGDQDSSTTVNFTCAQTNLFLAGQAVVTMCANIGTGVGGQINPRLMKDGTGHNLQFQLYTDSSRSMAYTWGSIGSSTPPYQISFTVPGAFFGFGGTYDDHFTVYARVPTGQAGLAAGSYTNLISDSFLTLNSSTNSTPATCGAGNDGNFSLNVTATVQNTCTVAASNLNFGTPAGLLSSSAHDGTSAITVKCLNGTAYKVALNYGQHSIGNVRRMQGGSSFVQYEIYRNAGRTQRWGNALGVDTVNGSGSGNNQSIDVYGRVPPQTTPAAGTYNDTITVTVTY